MISFIAVAFASPWIIVPIVTILRARKSRTLNNESAVAPDPAPSVSLVIPARNEVRSIERCVRSALASEYPRLDVVAVDDHSTDGTGDVLRIIAEKDERLQIVTPPPLPDGWFGKQWACAAGARHAGGEIIGFLDADTWQSPDMVTRIINAMQSRSADLITVGGSQEMESFWERIIQPQVFVLMLVRYGGSEVVNKSRRKEDKLANGQCIFVKRAPYDQLGGHGAVRDRVAEDLALAQLYFTAGLRSFLVIGIEQFSTRMYTSLSELVAGWGKNFYAGGRDAMPGGRAGRIIYPAVLISPWLLTLLPPLCTVLGALGVIHGAVFQWGAIVTALSVLLWTVAYRLLELPLFYAALYPLGAATMLYVSIGSILRGKRVRWKERDYVVSS